MRIGSSQSAATRIATVLEQQRGMSRLQTQATSGRKDTRLSDIAADVGRVVDLGFESARMRGAIETLNGLGRTLRASGEALGNLQDIAQRGRAMLVQAMGINNPNFDLYQVQAQANAMLDDAFNVLNRRFEGRFLFNDMAPDIPPASFRDEWTVRFSADSPPARITAAFADGLQVTADVVTTNGVVDPGATSDNLRAALRNAGRLGAVVEIRADNEALFILGNIGDAKPGGIVSLTADVANGIDAGIRNTRQRGDIDVRTIDYATVSSTRDALTRPVENGIALAPTVRVDEPAIEKLVRALRQLANADIQGTEGRDRLKQANALMIESIEDFGALRATVGMREAETGSLASAFELNQIATDSTVSEIRDVDLADLMTKIAAQQVQLEAAFMMLSKLGQLTLVNHLR
jgi:flagellin-like hook-associated protein FlgL